MGASLCSCKGWRRLPSCLKKLYDDISVCKCCTDEKARETREEASPSFTSQGGLDGDMISGGNVVYKKTYFLGDGSRK